MAVGTGRMRTKMVAAVALTKIYAFGPIDRTLATPAELGQFADETPMTRSFAWSRTAGRA